MCFVGGTGGKAGGGGGGGGKGGGGGGGDSKGGKKKPESGKAGGGGGGGGGKGGEQRQQQQKQQQQQQAAAPSTHGPAVGLSNENMALVQQMLGLSVLPTNPASGSMPAPSDYSRHPTTAAKSGASAAHPVTAAQTSPPVHIDEAGVEDMRSQVCAAAVKQGFRPIQVRGLRCDNPIVQTADHTCSYYPIKEVEFLLRNRLDACSETHWVLICISSPHCLWSLAPSQAQAAWEVVHASSVQAGDFASAFTELGRSSRQVPDVCRGCNGVLIAPRSNLPTSYLS